MLTRADLTKLLLPGVKTEFMGGMGEVPTSYGDYTMAVKSTRSLEDYAWLGSAPAVKEFVDERKVDEVLEKSFTLVNQSWENTFGVDREALEDEQYGQIMMRARDLGGKFSIHKDQLGASTVEAGTSSNAYDGQFFFDTDHSEGESGVQSNLLVGAPYAFGADALKSIISAMGQFKTDKGDIAGIRATHIMVPTDLEWAAREILDPSALSAGGTTPEQKVLAGRLKIIVNPYLTNNGTDSAYYVMDLGKSVKPFIYQSRKEAEIAMLTKPEDIENFMRKKLLFGGYARYTFGYGEWRLALRAAGA